MHPVLFDSAWLGSINSYGTLIMLGGMLIGPGVWWDARQRGVSTPFVFLLDFYLVLIFGSFLGGRLLYVLTSPLEHLADPARIFDLDEGFVFFGSVLGVVAGFFVLGRRYERRVGEICDILATWMALSHAFGRAGCFLSGCCWGAPCSPELAIAARFPENSVVYLTELVPQEGAHTIPLHPVQAYEALGLLLLFVVLTSLRRRRGPERLWVQSSRWALGYGLLRFVTEIFRGDPSRGYLLRVELAPLTTALGLPADQPVMLSVSQAIGAALVLVASWYLLASRSAATRNGPKSPEKPAKTLSETGR
ncbi:MAG: prolipoprotein diacylglyceryl transferase [Myxococcales bacterium]|nr:prolipoprotein diacylglyceryl transferase [Myxococcales bacterium]